MEEKELRMTYGMCFKVAGEVVTKFFDPAKETTEELVQDIEALAARLTEVALAAQEEIKSEYAHLITAAPKRGGYGKSSGGSYSRGSGGTSSAKVGPGPATAKQLGLARRLMGEKPGAVPYDIEDLESMTKAEVSTIIDDLINA